MWKRVLLSLALVALGFLLAAVSAAAFLAVQAKRPELTDRGLRQEMTVLGLTVGQSTRDELVSRLGPPESERQEARSSLLSYPSQGLLFRVDEAGRLYWYEFTSDRQATARGIRVGSSYDQLIDAYGLPDSAVPLSRSIRIRYRYGLAYTLEFWLTRENRVERIAFYQS